MPLPSVATAVSRSRRLVLVMALLGLVFGSLWYLSGDPTATATASVIVKNPDNLSTTDNTYVNNQVKTVELPTVAQAAAVIVNNGPGNYHVNDSFIYGGLSVGSSPSDALLTINFTDSDPALAQTAANAVAQAYEQVASQQAMAGARQQVTALRAALSQINQELLNTPSKADQAALATSRNALYAELGVQLAASVQGPNFVQSSAPASLPVATRPSSLMTRALIGLFAGLIIGVIAAYVLQLRRRKVYTAHEAATVLAAPAIGVVQRPVPGNEQSNLPVFWRPESLEAEGYRVITTTISLRHEAAEVVAVTSALAEGFTSSVLLNVAIAAAAERRRVVVVDGGRKRQELTRLLHSLQPVGRPSTVIGGSKNQLLELSGGVSLWYTSAGGSAKGGSTGMSPEACRAFVASLRQEFDLVLIDAPGMLDSAFSSVLVACSEAVLPVVAEGDSMTLVGGLRDRIEVSGLAVATSCVFVGPARRGGSLRRGQRGIPTAREEVEVARVASLEHQVQN